MTKTNNAPCIEFLTDIKAKIRQSQYEALKKVNKTLLSLYWDIGDKNLPINIDRKGLVLKN